MQTVLLQELEEGMVQVDHYMLVNTWRQDGRELGSVVHPQYCGLLEQPLAQSSPGRLLLEGSLKLEKEKNYN